MANLLLKCLEKVNGNTMIFHCANIIFLEIVRVNRTTNIFDLKDQRYPSQEISESVINIWKDTMDEIKNAKDLSEDTKRYLLDGKNGILTLVIRQFIEAEDHFEFISEKVSKILTELNTVTDTNIRTVIVMVGILLNSVIKHESEYSIIHELFLFYEFLLHWENNGIDYSEISKFDKDREAFVWYQGINRSQENY